jgi:signal recognition particle subunit SRP54
MFESLRDRLGSVVSKLRNRGRLSEADVDEILGEIRTALLEADVNVGVMRSVLARIRDKAVGAEMSKALDPAQQVVKTVHAELIGLLGGDTLKIT